MRRIVGITCLTAFAGLSAFTGQAQTPAPDAKPIVLMAAHLFDGASGKLVSPGLVIVRGKTIEAVGADAVPAAAQVIDLGDATLVPGYIDAHTHMASDYDESWTRGFYNSMMRLPVEQAYHAEHNAHVTLQAGVTTIREVGAPDYIDVALRNAIEQGLAEGPRMLVSAHAIGSTGGHCDAPNFPPNLVREFGEKDGVCNGADSCRRAVREQLKSGADNIKICASGGVLSEPIRWTCPSSPPKNCTPSSTKRMRGGARWRHTHTGIARRGWRWMPAWIRSSTAASSPPKRCSA